ncbi:hypothetical protein M427DRAFT_50315 [Gonapodya prolifera JEL478]|uniref:Uncharacterized protein n=1 Tax=Gonapodya prolifera (strain JEL478) TaxID=1344416 RepID=A0A138ZWC5_GONPJ|nr:hypothetical protein M427DRAFT_50315 [Gonapodya prolifera JEL478]|eukprot:KXS08797.1 hypothetical protein M427DRAFT_50315 [Gonapodya prolifera JEL478]
MTNVINFNWDSDNIVEDANSMWDNLGSHFDKVVQSIKEDYEKKTYQLAQAFDMYSLGSMFGELITWCTEKDKLPFDAFNMHQVRITIKFVINSDVCLTFFGNVFGWISKALVYVFQAITSVFTSLGSLIGGTFGNLLSSLGGGINSLVNSVGSGLGSLGGIVSNGVGGVIGGVGGAIGGVGGVIGSGVGSVGGAIGSGVGSVGGAIGSGIGGAGGAIGGALGGIF